MGVYLGKNPVGVAVQAGKGYVKYCNVEQIIDGDVCELIITDGDENSQFTMGFSGDGTEIGIYICEK